MAAISSGDVAFCQDPTSSSCVQLSPAAGPTTGESGYVG